MKIKDLFTLSLPALSQSNGSKDQKPNTPPAWRIQQAKKTAKLGRFCFTNEENYGKVTELYGKNKGFTKNRTSVHCIFLYLFCP